MFYPLISVLRIKLVNGCTITMAALSMSLNSSQRMKIALIQNRVTKDKQKNIDRAFFLVRQADKSGANLVALPECFQTPYGNQYFADYAEPIPGPTTAQLKALALELRIYLIGGSIPERDGGMLYNTTTVFNPEGEMILKFRKLHLFDIDIPGEFSFFESDTLSSGSKLGFFDTNICRVGIGICYDIRFPELAMLMNDLGSRLLVYPGCFNMITGPAHWELLIRSRALDNQCFCCAVSQARDSTSSYVAWGHSTISNPWGEVIAKAGFEEEIILSELDFQWQDKVRNQIPIQRQKRKDIYKLSYLS